MQGRLTMAHKLSEWHKSFFTDKARCVVCHRTIKQGHLKACPFSRVKQLEAELERLNREYGLLEVTYEGVLEDKAKLLDEVERLREHLDRLWTYLRGFEPFRTWMEEQDALQESE